MSNCTFLFLKNILKFLLVAHQTAKINKESSDNTVSDVLEEPTARLHSCAGRHDDYKLLKSSFLLLQSMVGAFLAARFWWALSLAWARDTVRAGPSPEGCAFVELLEEELEDSDRTECFACGASLFSSLWATLSVSG